MGQKWEQQRSKTGGRCLAPSPSPPPSDEQQQPRGGGQVVRHAGDHGPGPAIRRWGPKQLLATLQRAIDKEKTNWHPLATQYQRRSSLVRLERSERGRLSSDVSQCLEFEIDSHQRDSVVQWLWSLTREFHFLAETFALSVWLLDAFLNTVKAKCKYLRCIAISCLFLACKTKEEDEVIPTTLELVRSARKCCTVSEVLRMEKLVLDKLHWNVNHITALDFLHILHALLLCERPSLLSSFVNMTASRQISLLTRKLTACLSYHTLLAFSPSAQALALVSLELEQFSPDWLSITLRLQKAVKLGSQQLIRCREITSRYLATSPDMDTQHLYRLSTCLTILTPSNQQNNNKRKVEQIEVEDIYDSIKRLYNDESNLIII